MRRTGGSRLRFSPHTVYYISNAAHYNSISAFFSDRGTYLSHYDKWKRRKSPARWNMSRWEDTYQLSAAAGISRRRSAALPPLPPPQTSPLSAGFNAQ